MEEVDSESCGVVCWDVGASGASGRGEWSEGSEGSEG
jgi:hypothetical protein